MLCFIALGGTAFLTLILITMLAISRSHKGKAMDKAICKEERRAICKKDICKEMDTALTNFI